MLLTIEWHPWFSYEWWADIGVPAVGAIAAGLAAVGSVAVGLGAFLVARQSLVLAKAIADTEASAEAASARAAFARELKDWLDARFSSYESGDRARAIEALERVELEAESVGQSAPSLVTALVKQTRRVGDGSQPVDRLLTRLQRQTAIDSISIWVRSPEEWHKRELKALKDRVARVTARLSDSGSRRS